MKKSEITSLFEESHSVPSSSKMLRVLLIEPPSEHVPLFKREPSFRESEGKSSIKSGGNLSEQEVSSKSY